MHESLWQEPRWNAGRRARPKGARAAARKAAEVTEQRLTAFRFLFLSFVARVERSETRERHLSFSIVPGFRSAPSGLRLFGLDRDEAGNHRRIYLTKIGSEVNLLGPA